MKKLNEDAERIILVANTINAIKRMNPYAMPYLMAVEVLLHQAAQEANKTEEYEKFRYISEVDIDKE